MASLYSEVSLWSIGLTEELLEEHLLETRRMDQWVEGLLNANSVPWPKVGFNHVSIVTGIQGKSQL